MSVLDRRRAALQKTVDRYQGKSFRWGRRDCAQMLNFHLRANGLSSPVGRIPPYQSQLGAAKALRKLGMKRVTDCLAGFEEIPPAAVVIGDVLELEDSDAEGFGALAIYNGNGVGFMFHEEEAGAVMARILEAKRAWRIIPHSKAKGADGQGS